MSCAAFVAAFLFLFAAVARPQTAAPPPGSTESQSGTSYVIELQQTRVLFQDDGRGRRELTLRVKVLDEQAVRRWGQLALAYAADTEDLAIEELRVQKPDGSVAATAASAIQDLAIRPFEQLPIFLDLHQKQVTVPALRPGDVIDLRAVWTITNPVAAGQFWFEYTFSKDEIVRDERLEIDVPAQRTLAVKTRPGTPAEEHSAGVEAGRRIYRWHRANAQIPPVKAESIGAEQPPADVRVTSFRNWEELAHWWRKLLAAPAAPSVESKARELTAGLRSDSDRLDRIYSYVASQVRYLSLSFGLGRFAPHAPEEVLKNQYGDCKDKVTLLGTMLAAAGVNASAVLINTRRSVDPDFASPLEFDHVISAVVRGEDPARWTWMDTTAEIAPLGMLPAALRGRRGLLVGSESSGSKLVETPADPPFPLVDVIDVRGEVDPIGVLRSRVTFRFRSDSELAMRALVRAAPPDGTKELARRLAEAHGLTGEVTDVTTGDPTDWRMPFELAFRFRSAGYLDWAAKSSGVAVIPRVDFPFATEADRETMPRLVLGSPYRVQLNTEIELPPGYTIQPGVPVTTANAGFTYTSAYEASGRRLVVRRELSSTLREIPSQRFAEYSALIVAAKADFDQRPRVIGTMTEMPPVPDDATASELYSAAYNAFQAKKYKAAAMLWKRTTDVDPKMRSAWDSLGLAYDELGEYDEAIAAVQKQIELDRFDKRAYGDLGRIYQHANKGELAVKAYTRHLELNPLDGDVLKALGLLYWDLNRYSEAATTLEKASPLLKDGWMQAVLGSAYLRLHRQADARKAFDRAVELDSKAAVLAKVGWEMATAGVDLDRAGDLLARAEKQIAQSTEQLDVENVKPEHLDAMERIAWCWDGRAWIDFQRGNLAEAERYAQAAWLLGGEPEMAYHLGRVYEKRSRLADAMNYYLTAQATASDPTPEMIAHVKSLAGGGDLKLMLDSARRLASSDRIVQLPGKLFDGSADFLVVVGPDRHAVDVTFRSGTDALRSIDGALRQVQYPIAFPDDTRLRLALGVHVICERAHGCLAAVAFPRTVRLTE